MSKNYELLRILGKAQSGAALPLQSSATAINDVCPLPWGRGTPLHTEERYANEALPSRSSEPAGGKSDQVSDTSEPLIKAWARNVVRLIRRGDAAVSDILGNSSLWQLLHAQFEPKTSLELASIAREEQVKLLQRVFLASTPASRVIAFSGIDKGDGCSRICAESAVLLAAQVPGTVCLIDADLRSPTLNRIFAVENEKGFAESILQPGPISKFTRRVASGNLQILTSGAATANPHALLMSEGLRIRLQQLREAFDFVLIDTPPLNCSFDATQLASLADGIVLVMAANSTRRDAARKAKHDLNVAGVRLLGAVLNRRTFPIPDAIYRKL